MGRGAELWFGTTQHAQWVRWFESGPSRGRDGYSDEIVFENGGRWLEESAAWSNSYSLRFLGDPTEMDGVEVFSRFASREYGPGFLYFVDPMYAASNLFNMSWAAPGLIEQGWKNHGGNTPSFSETGANDYGKPARKATWSIDAAVGAVFGRAFTLLIPPGYTLHLGGSGAVTGTGALVVLPAGGIAESITLSTDAAAPAFTNTVDGDVAGSATVYMTRTSTATSTVTLTALWAQILPTGESPMIARHLPGQGTTGCRFRGKALPETYEATEGGSFVSLSTELVEVEAWE